MKQFGFEEGSYGEAETLARAKDVAIEDELRDAQDLVTAQGGSVQLRPLGYFSANRLPSSGRITAWEGCFRMAWNLDHQDGSIHGAADIVRRMGSDAESVERLARILYNHFDRTRDFPPSGPVQQPSNVVGRHPSRSGQAASRADGPSMMDGPRTPLGLKYQLENQRLPFSREQLLQLARDQTGVYALWVPEGGLTNAYTSGCRIPASGAAC